MRLERSDLFPGVTVKAIPGARDGIPARPGVVVEAHLDGSVSVHYGDEVVRAPATVFERLRGPLVPQDALVALERRRPSIISRAV